MGVNTTQESKKKVSNYIFFNIVFEGVVYNDVQFLQVSSEPNIISGEILHVDF
jgi:hypothetical protein